MAVRGHRGVRVQHSREPSRPTGDTILVQGTSTTESVFAILPRLADSDAPNVKVVAAVEFALTKAKESLSFYYKAHAQRESTI